MSRNTNYRLKETIATTLLISSLLTGDSFAASVKRTMSEINKCMSEAVGKHFPKGGAQGLFFGFTMVDQSGTEIRVGSFGKQSYYEFVGIGETDWKIECRVSKKNSEQDRKICMVWNDQINCLITKYKWKRSVSEDIPVLVKR